MQIGTLSNPRALSASICFLAWGRTLIPAPPYIFLTSAKILSSIVPERSYAKVKSPFSSSQSLTTSRARASPPHPPSAQTVERTTLTPSSRHFLIMKSISASVSVGNLLTATTDGSVYQDFPRLARFLQDRRAF